MNLLRKLFPAPTKPMSDEEFLDLLRLALAGDYEAGAQLSNSSEAWELAKRLGKNLQFLGMVASHSLDKEYRRDSTRLPGLYATWQKAEAAGNLLAAIPAAAEFWAEVSFLGVHNIKRMTQEPWYDPTSLPRLRRVVTERFDELVETAGESAEAYEEASLLLASVRGTNLKIVLRLPRQWSEWTRRHKNQR